MPRKPRPRPSHFLNGIDVSAFLAVQLAILFLLLGDLPHFHTHHASLDLPTVDNPRPLPDARREDAMLVAVTRDGSVFFRTIQIRPIELPNQIRQALQEGARPTVFVRADTRAKYGDIAAVIDQVRDYHRAARPCSTVTRDFLILTRNYP